METTQTSINRQAMVQKNEVQMRAAMWVKTSYDVRGARHKGHVLQDFTKMKYPEWAHSNRMQPGGWRGWAQRMGRGRRRGGLVDTGFDSAVTEKFWIEVTAVNAQYHTTW